MVVQKQSMPSFASIFSVLSIMLYCAGLNYRLQSFSEARSPLNDADMKIIRNAPDTSKSWHANQILWFL